MQLEFRSLYVLHNGEEFVATSQTPGPAKIYLQLAKHYLVLAELEKGKALDPAQSLDR